MNDRIYAKYTKLDKVNGILDAENQWHTEKIFFSEEELNCHYKKLLNNYKNSFIFVDEVGTINFLFEKTPCNIIINADNTITLLGVYKEDRDGEI